MGPSPSLSFYPRLESGRRGLEESEPEVRLETGAEVVQWSRGRNAPSQPPPPVYLITYSSWTTTTTTIIMVDPLKSGSVPHTLLWCRGQRVRGVGEGRNRCVSLKTVPAVEVDRSYTIGWKSCLIGLHKKKCHNVQSKSCSHRLQNRRDLALPS